MQLIPGLPRRDLSLDILIVGPYPPPLGGVSTHVKRLASLLARDGIRVGVLNHFRHDKRSRTGSNPLVVGTVRRNPLLYWLAIRSFKANLVHYHEARPSTLIAVALARRRSPAAFFLITIHGQVLLPLLQSRVPGVARCLRWALGQFDRIVAVSAEIKAGLDARLQGGNVDVIPAYLPSGPSDEGRRLPDEVEREMFQRPGQVLVVSAYRVVLLGADTDLYGLDWAVDVFRRLARTQPGLRLAIFLARSPDTRAARRYLRRLAHKLDDAGLSARYRVYSGLDLAPAFSHDVIYLRPSRTDGDAVSIREALARNVPVLASDAVQRPIGTQILPLRDLATWCAAVDGLSRSMPMKEDGTSAQEQPGDSFHGRKLFSLYADCLNPAEGASE